MSKYIDFKIIGVKPKTRIYSVFMKEGDQLPLGDIKWYAPWRKYAFFPHGGCTFESTCLMDICSILNTVTNEHRNGWHNPESEKNQ